MDCSPTSLCVQHLVLPTLNLYILDDGTLIIIVDSAASIIDNVPTENVGLTHVLPFKLFLQIFDIS